MLSKPVHSLCQGVCIRPVSFYSKWQESNFIWLWLKKETSLTCNECQERAGFRGKYPLELPFSLLLLLSFLTVGSVLPTKDEPSLNEPVDVTVMIPGVHLLSVYHSRKSDWLLLVLIIKTPPKDRLSYLSHIPHHVQWKQDSMIGGPFKASF